MTQVNLKTLAEQRGFTPEHINKLLHHTASENKFTWVHVRNVFTGKGKSKFVEAILLENMDLPEDSLTGRVTYPKNGSQKITHNGKPTPCRCVTCEKHYTRVIYWTGTLPARIRCTACNHLLGIKDYCEVFAWRD